MRSDETGDAPPAPAPAAAPATGFAAAAAAAAGRLGALVPAARRRGLTGRPFALRGRPAGAASAALAASAAASASAAAAASAALAASAPGGCDARTASS